jgi:hypothetical protein
MQATPRDARAHADEQRERPRHDGGDGDDRSRDAAGERERFGERRRRVGAAQMAAPSTRRWRRAGRFSAAD